MQMMLALLGLCGVPFTAGMVARSVWVGLTENDSDLNELNHRLDRLEKKMRDMGYIGESEDCFSLPRVPPQL